MKKATSSAFLAHPEHRKAFDYLSVHNQGTTRQWATQLGWSQSKLVRFLAALKRHGIAHVTAYDRFTVFHPEPPPDAEEAYRKEPERTESNRIVPAPYLGSRSGLLTAPRCALAREGQNDKKSADYCYCPGAELSIAAVNDTFSGHAEYEPISLDMYGSHRVVTGWVAKGIPVEACARLTLARARKWNIGRSGGFPRSLGHPWFLFGVPKDWRLECVEEAKGQLALTLLTTIEDEKKVAVPATEAEPEKPLEEGSPPTPPQPISAEAQEAWRTAFQTAQPGKRLEIA